MLKLCCIHVRHIIEMYWGIWRFRFCNWQVRVGNTFWFNYLISITLVRLKSSLFMILSRFKDVINWNIEASSENFIVISSVYSMPSLSFLNVSLVFLTALLLSSATFLLLKQLACHSQKFLDQLSNLSYMVQEPQRMHFTTILSLNFRFFLPILPIPGEAKAKVMPGWLYNDNKWIIK